MNATFRVVLFLIVCPWSIPATVHLHVATRSGCCERLRGWLFEFSRDSCFNFGWPLRCYHYYCGQSESVRPNFRQDTRSASGLTKPVTAACIASTPSYLCIRGEPQIIQFWLEAGVEVDG